MKADFLITLIGTSAMPNLIGIATRIKNGGKVYFIHTNETKTISENLVNYIEENKVDSTGKSLNIKSELIGIENYDNPEEVYNEIQNKFRYIYDDIESLGEKNSIIEINFTGGTKVISSISYTVFKELFKEKYDDIKFTYLDGENSRINIHNVKQNKEQVIEYSKEIGTIPLTIMDVINVNKDLDEQFSNDEGHFKQSEFSKDMYQYLISHKEKRKEIIEYLECLNSNLRSENINKSANKVLNYLDKFANENNLLDGYKSHKDFLKALYVDESKISNTKVKSLVIKPLIGNWFEEVIHKILVDLRDEDIIDDFICNLKKMKKIDKMEIDFIAMKNYKLYYISVSTVEDMECTKFKLYEIKQRAQILSGTEAAVATITFVQDKKEIIDGYKNIWQEEPKNALMIEWGELDNIKNIISQWVGKKGC